MDRDSRTISMEGSEKLSWDDVDKYIDKHGIFTSTSSYIQYLLEKDILGFKTKMKDVILLIVLLLILLAVLQLSFLLVR